MNGFLANFLDYEYEAAYPYHLLSYSAVPTWPSVGLVWLTYD